MMYKLTRLITLLTGLMLLAACSSPAAPKDYRYDEQKRAAQQGQQELSREMDKRY
jgi:PBP1b-binding outer membrane lipoprotein LpoB